MGPAARTLALYSLESWELRTGAENWNPYLLHTRTA